MVKLQRQQMTFKVIALREKKNVAKTEKLFVFFVQKPTARNVISFSVCNSITTQK